MGRILAIDYGIKRTGIAVTDPLKIIATALTTISAKELINFLRDYFSREIVDTVIIGLPVNWDESSTHATPHVKAFISSFKKQFPEIPIETVDERLTSKMARDSMLEMGLKKSQRRRKELVDQIAAVIMLQEYLQKRTGDT